MSWIRSRSALWATIGVLALALFVSRCAPSAPKGAQKGRCRLVGHRRRGTEDLRRARATSTSTTSSPPAATPGRCTCTACRRCATSRRSRSSRPIPAPGTGSTTTSKKMLGNLTWGDVHHPALSETNGDYDGRWLFVNDMNGRIARIDLRDFKTKQIIGPDPERVGQPRLGVRHAGHQLLRDGVAVLNPDPEGHGGRDREVRDRLQGRDHRHQDRSQERRDELRLAGPHAAVRLRPRRRGQDGHRTATCSSRRTTPSARQESSK